MMQLMFINANENTLLSFEMGCFLLFYFQYFLKIKNNKERMYVNKEYYGRCSSSKRARIVLSVASVLESLRLFSGYGDAFHTSDTVDDDDDEPALLPKR